MSIRPLNSGLSEDEKAKKEGSRSIDIVLVEKREFDSLKKILEGEREKLRDLENKFLYLKADFENYRKRTEAFIQEQAAAMNERLISDMLEIVDELELAFKAGENLKETQQLLNGIRLILNKLYQLLERNGIKKISSTGNEFDPRLHQAVERVPTSELPEGRIVEELRSGFMLRNKVLRPSLVKVSYRPNQTSKGEVMSHG